MVSGRRGRAAGAALAAALAVSALAGCGSGYTYATRAHPKLLYRTSVNGATGLARVEAASTYFKLPPGWSLLDEDEFVRASGALATSSPEEAAFARRKQRYQPFDAADDPSVRHVLSSTSAHPTGYSVLYVLDDDERDGVSLRALRNALVPIDPDPVSGDASAEVLYRDDKVVQPGGFHGSRVIANVKADDGTLLTIDKTTLVDKDTRVIYLFLVGCEAACFRAQQKTIAQVVESWTIKER